MTRYMSFPFHRLWRQATGHLWTLRDSLAPRSFSSLFRQYMSKEILVRYKFNLGVFLHPFLRLGHEGKTLVALPIVYESLIIREQSSIFTTLTLHLTLIMLITQTCTCCTLEGPCQTAGTYSFQWLHTPSPWRFPALSSRGSRRAAKAGSWVEGSQGRRENARSRCCGLWRRRGLSRGRWRHGARMISSQDLLGSDKRIRRKGVTICWKVTKSTD